MFINCYSYLVIQYSAWNNYYIIIIITLFNIIKYTHSTKLYQNVAKRWCITVITYIPFSV